MDSYNNMNHMSGQPMPPINETTGQRPGLFPTEPMTELRGHYTSATYVQQMRRPNVAINSTNDSVSDSINELTKQTNLLSFGSNETNYNNIGGAGDLPNTSWIQSESKEPTPVAMSSLVSTLGGSNLSPFAKEFVPRTTMSYSAAPPVANGLNTWHQMPSMNENRDMDDFIALRIDYLTEVLNTYIDEDETVMDSVVNIIVDQAIVEPQFRYNGVRLCIYLMTKLVVLSEDKDFKKLLLRRCQREYSRRDELIRSSSTIDYLRGLTLFIGDLYSRLGYEELAQILPQLLLTLLSNPEKENLKCICQVLKLCGSHLESYFTERKTNESNDLNKVMEELKVCSEDKSISPYVKELMTNIIEMQKRSWTANMPSTASASNPVVNPYLNTNTNTNTNTTENNWNNSGEYYEEYNNYSDEEDFLHQASYDFGQCGDEDDNEVCEAFEEFLKNSGQTK